MASPAHRDYGRLLDVAAATIAGMARDDAWPAIADEINTSLRGTVTIFEAGMRPADRVSRVAAWAPETAGDRPLQPRIRAQGAEHPLTAAFAHGELRPLIVEDVTDSRTWRANPWYEAGRRRFDGAVRHLGLPLPAASGTVRAFLVARSGRNFNARERELARRFQPLLIAVDGHLTELNRLQLPAALADPPGLTPRELAVLSLLARGLTAAAIGRQLQISPHTVTKHLEHIYRKLECSDRLTAVLLTQELGLISRGS